MKPDLPNLLLTIVIALSAGLILLLRKRASGTVPLSGLIISLAVWAMTYLLYQIPALHIPKDVLKAVSYLCLALAATFQLYFALDYANRSRWINQFTIFIFLIEPAIIQMLFWVESLRRTFFPSEIDILDRLNLLYTLHLLAGSIIFLLDTFVQKPRVHFFKAGTILLGAIFPLVGTIFIFFINNLETSFFISILCYSMAVVGISYG